MNSIQRFIVLAIMAGCQSSLTAETRVLFCSDKGATQNMFDLYTLRTDGTDLQRLTTTPGISEWAPALAPDSQRVVYVARSASSLAGNLFLTDLAGAAPVQIPTPKQALAVEWENNDTLIYFGFVSNQWGSPYFDIRRVHLDGSSEGPVYPGPFWVFSTGSDSFDILRAAGRLFFTTTGSSPTSGAVTLRSGLLSASAPDIQYASGIETLYADPQEEWPVPGDYLQDHYDFAISPDGSRLAYCADHGSGYHRLYLRAGGGDPATQTRLSDAFCGDPDFAPDGTALVFTRCTTSTYGAGPYVGNLIRIGVDGANETNLTAGLAAVSGRCALPVVYSVGAPEIEPACLQAIQLIEGGGVRLVWSCQAGASYQVEYSPDLATWNHDLPSSRITAQPGETSLQYTDTSSRQSRRFYRVAASGTR